MDEDEAQKAEDEAKKAEDLARSDRNLTFLLWGLGSLFIVFLLIVLLIGRA